jgi:hypothetical protein
MAKFTANQIISKIHTFGDRVAGISARKAATHAAFFNPKNYTGKFKVKIDPSQTTRTERIAHVEKGRSFQARVKGAVGGAAAVGTGFLGLHKYHQHQDNKILARIDKMYEEG